MDPNQATSDAIALLELQRTLLDVQKTFLAHLKVFGALQTEHIQLKKDMALLKIAVEGLEAREQFRLDNGPKELLMDARVSARQMAQNSMFSEHLIRAGITPEWHDECLEERKRHFLDSLLQTSDSSLKNYAGQVDTRELDEIPTETGYRPLFDAHGDEEA